ncbi:iron permease [Mycena maculata]|uniref:Iron permease n=1 Tax=Mycena maculata TaxID=230809 RepID=A0AAD7HSQ9_9AGAR|nr:iron permease [Mycena maculata]
MQSTSTDHHRSTEDLQKIDDSSQVEPPKSTPKSRAFYMCFVAIMVAVFLSALDMTAVGTALPTIADALHDTKGNYIWVGSAYAMSSTAFIPLSGNLSNVFGRKIVMLISIGSFAVGSALAGASQNMSMMIGARAIQGIGGGGILTLTEILTADLVPLAERGLYQGLLAMVWALAAYTGPPIGGALANRGTKAWRWLFYLNLPLSAIAFLFVFIYLSVNRPAGSVRDKLARVDWFGNGILIVGTGLAIIGLTWGGIRYSWASAQVLAPLIIGLSLIVVFGVYEATVPVAPTIPRDVVGNRTSLSGLLTTIMHGIASIAMVYYIPVFFQACFGASPIRSAVDFLPGALTTTPFAFAGGLAITISKKYRVVNWFGWAVTIVGFGLFSTIRADSSVGKWVGYQIISAIGVGILFGAPIFPLLAPLPPNRAASALAMFSFTRAFSQTWGITIASTILQNQLKKKLPAAFIAQFPPGIEIAYAAIPVIRQLEGSLRTEVQAAFADSMAVIWQTMIGVTGVGLLLSFLMAEVPMNTTVDESYALKDKKDPNEQLGDVEMR